MVEAELDIDWDMLEKDLLEIESKRLLGEKWHSIDEVAASMLEAIEGASNGKI